MSDPEILEMAGAPGTVYALPDTAADAALGCAAFFERMRTEYVLPAVRLEIVCGLVVPDSAVHDPASKLYSTDVIALPPSDAPSVKDTVRAATPPATPVMLGASGGATIDIVVATTVSAPQPTLLCAAALQV